MNLSRLDEKDLSKLYNAAMELYLNNFFSTDPSVLYKYRNWKDEHKRTLLNNEFYLISSKDTNDPFDMKIPYDFDNYDTNEKRERFIDDIIKTFPYRLDEKVLQEQKVQILEKFKLNPNILIENFLNLHSLSNEKNLGAFCLSER